MKNVRCIHAYCSFFTFNHAGHFGALHRICQGDINRKLGLAWPTNIERFWGIDQSTKNKNPVGLPACQHRVDLRITGHGEISPPETLHHHDIPRQSILEKFKKSLYIGNGLKNPVSLARTSWNEGLFSSFFPFEASCQRHSTTFLTEASALSQQSLVSQ
jgi:hypothetical protein